MANETSLEKQPPKSVWTLFVGIVDRPADTFAALLAYPRWKWVLPLILAALFTVASAWASAPYASELAQKAAEQQLSGAGMSPEEAQAAMAQTAFFTSPVGIGIIGSITGALFLVIVWVAVAALLYFMSLVAGAETNFGSVFTVFSWSSLPVALRSLVQTILILATGRFPLYTGLAALQVSGDALQDARNPMIALLSFADIFWIWHIILLTIGLAVATKFSRGKAFFIALIYVLLSIGLGVGATLLAARA
ncbi:MAG TPA: hypothetical protein G4N96_04465 [Chloroflexi bacterium]|nr:hypothetical protein [Chloroflexota bacterium]